MRIIQMYNRRRVWGGEDRMVETIIALLEKNGDTVLPWIRDNAEFGEGLPGKVRAFVSGIYSPSAARHMAARLAEQRPDVVHVHNLYPLFSPSVLVTCRRMGVPVCVHLHSYLLTCPTTFHLYEGKICNRCLGGREYACVLQNCRGNVAESLGYALRNAVARRLGLYRNNATLFLAISDFAKRRLMEGGYPEERIVVLYNTVPIPSTGADPGVGEYVAYAGRFTSEKGVETLLAAAAETGLPLRLAGDTSEADIVRSAPPNARFLGQLGRNALDAFYRGARFLVVPSIWYEPFGLVVAEAMAHGIPVVASRIGGLPELVDEGRTGLLFEPGNSAELARKIQLLWEDPELCRRMGAAARAKAIREYSEQVYYTRLVSIYADAIELARMPVSSSAFASAGAASR